MLRDPQELKMRLERVEGQLRRVLETTKTVHAQAVAAPVSSLSGHDDGGGGNTPVQVSWNFDPLEPKLYHGPSDKSLSLPPLKVLVDNSPKFRRTADRSKDIMPIIDYYFKVPNRALPLFSRDSMRLVTAWYSKTPKRDAVTWAAILMLIALGLRSLTPEDTRVCPDPLKRAELVSYCMRNTQAVMPELMSRDEDLLGIQAIPSLAMMFQNSADVKPSSILASTAMMLAHRMELERELVEVTAPEEARQRARVFWTAYILDKV